MQCFHVLLFLLCLHFSLEITLVKKNEGPWWPELIVGDTRGEFIMDPAQRSEIAESLMHLTSEVMVRSRK